MAQAHVICHKDYLTSHHCGTSQLSQDFSLSLGLNTRTIPNSDKAPSPVLVCVKAPASDVVRVRFLPQPWSVRVPGLNNILVKPLALALLLIKGSAIDMVSVKLLPQP